MANAHILVYLFTLALGDSASILAIFPAPCYSHQMAFRPLTLELARQGHHVTVITPFPAFPKGDAPANLTEISIARCIDELAQRALGDEMKDAKDIYSQQAIAFNAATEVFDIVMTELKGFLNSGRRFDLVLGELCVRFTIAFSEIFGAPFVQVSSFGGTLDTFGIVGAPVHPLLYPLAIRDKFKDLSMMERLRELYQHYRVLRLYHDSEEADNRVARKHLGDAFPTMSELTRNIRMIFLNVHPIWDSNRPVPPNLVYLGGLHLQPQRKLPQELKYALDATNATIYMSFGSTIRSHTLSRTRIDTILTVLAGLPYTVFWKWDLQVTSVPDNVIVRDWYPQADLLKHPKVKLFITQGGLQSIDEAIDAGVPMVGVPILWDQFYNADKVVELDIGVMCDIHSLTEDNFKDAVDTVISDHRYKENIERLRDIMKDQPQTPLQRAIWWIGHVLRHNGAKYMKSPAFNMSATDYFEVDLVLSVVAVSFVLLLIVVSVVKYSLRILFYRKLKKD